MKEKVGGGEGELVDRIEDAASALGVWVVVVAMLREVYKCIGLRSMFVASAATWAKLDDGLCGNVVRNGGRGVN